MQVKNWLVVSLVGLASGTKADYPSKEQTCFTLQGTKSLKTIPTVTKAHKETYTVYETQCDQKFVTVTPATVAYTAKKTTIVTVNTTLQPRTHTLKVVATKYTTSTLTKMTTSTSTATIKTVTTISSTSTVPAPSGFRPIRDTLKDSANLNRLVGSPLRRSDSLASDPKGRQRRDEKYPTTKKKSLYPQKVECSTTSFIPKTITMTKTKPAITVTAKAPRKTILDIQTITSTHTVVPSYASVLTTSTAVSTIYATVTEGTTTTTTATIFTAEVSVPGPTVYAMCAKNNFANVIKPKGGVGGATTQMVITSQGPRWLPLFQTTSATAKNAYECCTFCAIDNECIGFQMGPPDRCEYYKPGPSACTLDKPCAGAVTWYVDYEPSSSLGNGRGLQWSTVTILTAAEDA